MKRTSILIALLFLVIGSTMVMAQPRAKRDGNSRAWREHRDPHAMTEAFRLYKLTEYLELSEEQTAKLFPRMAELRKQRDEQQDQMQAKMKELYALVKKEDWGKAAKLADELQAMRVKHMEAQHEAQANLVKLLSEEQRAKFALFEHKFQGHLHEMGQRLHREKGPRGGGPGDGPGPRGEAPGGDCDGEGPHGPHGHGS